MHRRVDLGPGLCGQQKWTDRDAVSGQRAELLYKALKSVCSSSIEILIQNGFKPTRTVVLSFGFDEEVSGGRGAKALSEYLLSQYGEDGIAMLIDEGGLLPDTH